jgi:hypothetical protein
LVKLETLHAKQDTQPAVPPSGCSEAQIWNSTRKMGSNDLAHTYICQMTQIREATTFLAWWDVRQYLEDYWSGNVGLGRIVSGLIFSAYYRLCHPKLGLGPALKWIYDVAAPFFGGTLFPRKPGEIPQGQPTPEATLNLQPGEFVRVKSHEAILKTVTTDNKNRGMSWDAELVPYCGGTYRVLDRVHRMIDERSGKMIVMKVPCIILDSVFCQARYSRNRMLCPKAMYPYWREIWLERVDPQPGLASKRT